VILVNADSVVIREFTVRNGNTGIYFDRSNDSVVMENNAIDNVDAIFASLSDNCTIYRNLVGNNTHRGILVTNSWNFTVSNNRVYSNGWYGINANASGNGLIVQNNVNENYYDGIGLLNSGNCTVAENKVNNNVFFGIWLDSSDDNFIYHNNFINNGIQAIATLSTNHWDTGVEGNYWSNYTSIDLDHDGIGDSSHDIDTGNQDNYPLMGMFHSFNVSPDYNVKVVSNSTIDDFTFFGSNSSITMYVSNSSATQSFGFCRVCIPKSLISPPYTVMINDRSIETLYFSDTVYDSDTHRWIYFAYEHSTRKVEIIHEFPSTLAMALFMVATLLTVTVYRRKHSM